MHQGQILTFVFKVDKYPVHRDHACFHHYEGVTHPSLAKYSYCLLGDTVLVLPNRKARQQLFREVKAISYPWGSLVTLTPGAAQETISIPALVGERPLQVEV